MDLKYIIFNSKIKKYFYFFISIIIYNYNILFASGAFDKGSSAGKGNLEFSITINPFNKISYGQNYAMLSYGITNKFDLVSYYSEHYEGTKSIYYGIFYQFYSSRKIDIGTGLGLRKIDANLNNSFDYFFPQILYNYKLANGYSIGGSMVNLIDRKKIKKMGYSFDIALYIPLNKIKNSKSKIKEAYFSIGLFKNSTMEIFKERPYFHYSFDIIFDLKN